MPSIRQKRVAKILIDNIGADKPLTNGEIVELSGFGPSMKKNSKVVLESKGVQDALIEYGFHPDRAKEVVGNILEHGENETVKLKAADMVFKVNGTYAAEKHINLNIQAEPTDRIKNLAKKLNG